MKTNLPVDFEAALTAKIDNKTKPRGALGRLERLAAQVARLQCRLDPVMTDARMIVFAGDHGITAEGVSAYPAEVTRQMVLNFVSGGAAINVFAHQSTMALHVVNAGVRGGPFAMDGVEDQSLGEGTANFLHAPAMTPDQLERAFDIGRRIGAEGGVQAVGFGEMGIGNSSSASLIAHRLTGAPLAELVGRGTGLDDDGLLHKVRVLEASSARVQGALDPLTALREFGGFEIAMMTGAMLSAADAQRIVLVDGFIASAAALAAALIEPSARAAMVFCHRSREPGHRHILDALAARPLLDLDLALGEGTGAALAWPLVRAAVAMLNDMASFDEAGVSRDR